MTQLTFTLEHRPALGREDFLVAPCNAVAVAWIDRWPAWPVPVLVLHGDPGSGKSHLAQVWRARSGARQIAADRLAAAPVRDQLGEASACLIDDAEGLVGQAETERALFHLHNALCERGGHLLLTASRPPSRWPLRLADLRSRLGAAVPIELAGPDERLVEALLGKLFADRQLRPGKGVIEYLAARMERSYAAALQLVEEIDRRALREHREVRLPLARAALGETPQVE